MTATETERNNIESIERGFKAFAAGDMVALSELFEESVLWHSQPAGVLPGEYRGRDATFTMFGQLHEMTGGTFRSTPVAMAASGHKVFVQTEATGERSGRSLRASQVLIFTLSGGRVSEVQLFSGNHAAEDAFWK